MCYLDAQQQLLVGHLHPFEVVLYFSCPLCILLHTFDVLYRCPQYSAFVPAHITKQTGEQTGNFHL